MLWSFDTEQPPRSLKKHSRLISDSLVVRKGGWGCLSLPFSFFHCQYVTQCHSPRTWGNFPLATVDAHNRVDSTEAAPDYSLCYKYRNEQRKGVVSQPLLCSLHSMCLRGEIAECWNTVAVWVNVFFCSGLDTQGPDMCRGPCWSSQGLSSSLIFLAATATWARHFSAAFIFKCKACNGRR